MTEVHDGRRRSVTFDPSFARSAATIDFESGSGFPLESTAATGVTTRPGTSESEVWAM